MRLNERSQAVELEQFRQRVDVLRALLASGAHVATGDVITLMAGIADARVRALLDSWGVVAYAGASPMHLIDTFQASLRSDLRRDQRIEGALSGPRFAKLILLFLPLVSVLVMNALGFDCLGVLFGQPVGWAIVVVSGALIFAAGRWTTRMIAAARRTRPMPGLVIELVRIGVLAGVGVEHLIALVRDKSWFVGADYVGEFEQVRVLSAQCAHAGLPLERILAAAASRAVDIADEATDVRLGQLAEKVLLPLGVCLLPAFILLVAVPAIISTLSGTALLSG